jgi:hypothetical protein
VDVSDVDPLAATYGPAILAPKCKACGGPMRWAKLAGAWKALDPEEREPGAGRIAFNPRTGGARVLTPEDLERAWRWAYRGVTFHELHADVCPRRPGARRGGRRPGQVDLLAGDR